MKAFFDIRNTLIFFFFLIKCYKNLKSEKNTVLFGGSGGTDSNDCGFLPDQTLQINYIKGGWEDNFLTIFNFKVGSTDLFIKAKSTNIYTYKEFIVPTGEYINKIELYYGQISTTSSMKGIQFISNRNSKSDWFGYQTGCHFTIILNGELKSFKGKFGLGMDNLGFNYLQEDTFILPVCDGSCNYYCSSFAVDCILTFFRYYLTTLVSPPLMCDNENYYYDSNDGKIYKKCA